MLFTASSEGSSGSCSCFSASRSIEKRSSKRCFAAALSSGLHSTESFLAAVSKRRSKACSSASRPVIVSSSELHQKPFALVGRDVDQRGAGAGVVADREVHEAFGRIARLERPSLERPLAKRGLDAGRARTRDARAQIGGGRLGDRLRGTRDVDLRHLVGSLTAPELDRADVELV